MTELPINQIIQGDCLEVMRGWPDKCIDLVLTDPPYGIGESNEKNQTRSVLAVPKDFGHYDWDDNPATAEQIAELRRVSKHQVIFGGNFFALPPSSCWLVWDKDNGENDFADCELAWTSFGTAVRRLRWRWQGMLQEDMSNKEYRVHPTQKPLALMRWVISKYSDEGALILDPFAGSGTTLVAAKQLGRKYIGIEISEKYVAICKERLKQEQLPL